MFPLAVWNEDRTWNFPGFCSGIAEKGSYAYVSTDEGKTFKQLGCAQIQNRSFDENMILEMKDGSLRMFVRRLLKAKILLGGCDDKIIEIAKENSIPIVKNIEATEIISLQEIGEFIPEETYTILAKIFAFIKMKEGKVDE